MPELRYDPLQKDTSSEIQHYLFPRNGYYTEQDNDDIKKDKLNPSVIAKFDVSSSPSHDTGHVHRVEPCRETSTTKKARAKESSKHFGVRFRPDLNKWVAEIRVAEWKTVDKKVWLGTFETEEGAARAVDAARKLLRCKKKRPANFPCIELEAYPEQIPPNLNLKNLGNDAMFKDVTLFVKRKVQEYAASFSPPSKVSVSSSNLQVAETSVYSQPELLHVDMSLDLHDSFPSGGNWVNDSVLPICEAEVADDHWQQLFVAGESISQPGCSFDSVKSFYKNDFSDLVHCNHEHDVPHSSSWEDVISGNAMLEYSEPNLLEYYAQDETISMDIISGDEMSIFSEFQKPSFGIVDSNMDWMLQLHSHNNILTGLDCTHVY